MDFSDIAGKFMDSGAMSSMGSSGGGSGADIATKIYKKVRGVGQTAAKSAPSVGQGSSVEKPQYSTLDVTDINNQMEGDNYLSEKTDKSGEGKQANDSTNNSSDSSKSLTFKPSSIDNTGSKVEDAVKMHLTDKQDLSKPFNMQMGSSKDMFGNDMSNYSSSTPNNNTTINNKSTILSDERMKSLFGKDKSLDCFGKINAYMFRYKPEAQQAFKDKDLGVDDKVHVGVMAQELKSNPITSSTVNSDPMSGILTVDTKQLTMTNTAMIAELTRKVDMLEKILMEITHDKR